MDSRFLMSTRRRRNYACRYDEFSNTLIGFLAPFVLDGPINREAFEAYVEQVLSPELRPGDIVIMDNLSSHKWSRFRGLIEAAGAELQ